MERTECFKIQILKAKQKDIFDIKKMKPLYQINYNRGNLINEPVTIKADPFLFIHNNLLFLFYEEKPLYHKGRIVMTYTRDLKHWTKPTVVLKEAFHLSFPWVFKENGHVYMLPETGESGSVRLYKAIDEHLTTFKLKKVLLTEESVQAKIDISFADSSIYKKDGVYYLMTTLNCNRINQLYLFTSDSLGGPYHKHPCSPVCSSNKYGRNAGSLFEYDGHFYRVAQDCEIRYGDNIHIFIIDKLNEKEYQEHLVESDIIPTDLPFYKEGGHQFNFTIFNNQTVVATDAKEYHVYVWNRILHKLGCY